MKVLRKKNRLNSAEFWFQIWLHVFLLILCLQIDQELTRGLGAGGNPDVGMNAAKESTESIEEAVYGADMVFVTAGMGVGTGTGGAPIIAEIVKSMGILTIGIVTTPFSFEGRRRAIQAQEGIAALRENVDMLIVIPNDKLLTAISQNMTVTEACNLADDILQQGVRGISDIIMRKRTCVYTGFRTGHGKSTYLLKRFHLNCLSQHWE